MKIYTKQGDAGHTVLFDGTRVPKDHPLIETYGTVDELNSHLGLAAAACPHHSLRTLLTTLQTQLLTLGSDLATPPATPVSPPPASPAPPASHLAPPTPLPAATAPHEPRTPSHDPHPPRHVPRITGDHIAHLERQIDEATAQLPPLKRFIIPGGGETAARLHIARTVCRRAERLLATLTNQSPTPSPTLIYLNRLSDLLFTLARLANHLDGLPDIEWIPSS